MSVALKLTHDEPRLVYLALVYHLGRPGSELDPATRMPSETGLRAMKVGLGRDLGAESAIIEVDPSQAEKLLSAIYGCVTELRGHHLRDGATSTVPRFTDTAIELFPQIRSDPEEALAIAQAMVMLHRRMKSALDRAFEQSIDAEASDVASGVPPAAQPGRRWPFRR